MTALHDKNLDQKLYCLQFIQDWKLRCGTAWLWFVTFGQRFSQGSWLLFLLWHWQHSHSNQLCVDWL